MNNAARDRQEQAQLYTPGLIALLGALQALPHELASNPSHFSDCFAFVRLAGGPMGKVRSRCGWA